MNSERARAGQQRNGWKYRQLQIASVSAADISSHCVVDRPGSLEFMPSVFRIEIPSRRVWLFVGSWGLVLLGVKFGAAHLERAKDEGAVWLEMRDKLPADCNQIVVINEDLDGLRFYSGKNVSRVTTGLPSNDLVDYQAATDVEAGLEAKAPLAVVYPISQHATGVSGSA